MEDKTVFQAGSTGQSGHTFWYEHRVTDNGTAVDMKRSFWRTNDDSPKPGKNVEVRKYGDPDPYQKP